jgi:hypothetical protein
LTTKVVIYTERKSKDIENNPNNLQTIEEVSIGSNCFFSGNTPD